MRIKNDKITVDQFWGALAFIAGVILLCLLWVAGEIFF
jgi:uncharacterized membrane protein